MHRLLRLVLLLFADFIHHPETKTSYVALTREELPKAALEKNYWLADHICPIWTYRINVDF